MIKLMYVISPLRVEPGCEPKLYMGRQRLQKSLTDLSEQIYRTETQCESPDSKFIILPIFSCIKQLLVMILRYKLRKWYRKVFKIIVIK